MRRTNLMPKELMSQARFTFRTKIDYFLFLTVVIIISVALVTEIFQLLRMGIFAYQVKLRTRKLNSITTALDENRRIKENLTAQIESWQDKRKQLEERYSFLKEGMQQGILWSQVLEKLNTLVPARLWLVKLSLGKEKIKIKGNTYDNLLVSTFMSNLSNSNMFGAVNLNYAKKKKLKRTSPETDGRKVIEFEIECRLIEGELQESAEES